MIGSNSGKFSQFLASFHKAQILDLVCIVAMETIVVINASSSRLVSTAVERLDIFPLCANQTSSKQSSRPIKHLNSVDVEEPLYTISDHT